MDYPHVFALVHRDANRRAEHPMVRQRFGPVGVDFEVRRLHGVLALPGQLARDKKSGCREDSQQEECPAFSHRKPPRKMWPDYICCLWALGFGLWALGFGLPAT